MKLIKKLLLLVVFLPVCALAQQYVLFNGGVCTDEREAAPDEGTRLVFFASSGSYLSGVQVVIKDTNGRELVNVRTRGPWLILNLPTGQYQLEASLGDHGQGGVFSVDSNSPAEYAYMFATGE
ncbi:MAG: hypothetical protein ACO4AC_11040 [Pseudohongiellaceae bacterium]